MGRQDVADVPLGEPGFVGDPSGSFGIGYAAT
jgi:hypothetical protein